MTEYSPEAIRTTRRSYSRGLMRVSSDLDTAIFNLNALQCREPFMGKKQLEYLGKIEQGIQTLQRHVEKLSKELDDGQTK
jgi:hypothetical protein